MADILIENGIVITMDSRRRIIKDGAVAIEGDKVIEVGKTNEVKRKHSADFRIDARQKIVMPGLIDAHVHSIQMLARGLADDIDLIGWIHDRILPYEAAMTDKDAYVSALLCCLELIRNGTTCFADPGGYRMESVAKAIEESGMRGIIAWASMDMHDPERPVPPALRTTTEEALRRSEELIKKCHNMANGRIRVWTCLRVEPNVSEKLIKGINDLAKRYNVGVQMHAAVSKEQVEWVKKRTGLTVVEYLESLGVLGPHWLLIHMGWITDKEVHILKERDVKVCHVPGASLHGAYGSCSRGKFPELIKSGVTVGLGNDSSAANNSLDMFKAMYLAATCHKEARCDPTLISPEQALEMATVNNAKCLHWDNEIGSIEPGKKADIIIVNIRRSNYIPIHDFSIVPNLVYSGDGHDVETVIIDGKIIMENREVKTLDEAKVLDEAQKAAERIVGEIGLNIKPRWEIQ